MIRTVLIEDESFAAEALQALLAQSFPDIRVAAVLQTINESVDWLSRNPAPDLIFMDIHLGDGSSFTIFDEVEVISPVIFTTAYDEYALKAFEVNSVDYLLKPIAVGDMERALAKFRKFSGNTARPEAYRELLRALSAPKRPTSILVQVQDRIVPLFLEDAAYFYIESGTVRAVTFGERKFILDRTLDEISEKLDPTDFFRANRQFIISRRAVTDVSIWFGGKLAVNLSVEVPERIFISKARVKEFKTWLSGW